MTRTVSPSPEQSGELVERVVKAFDDVIPEWVPVLVRERYARAAIEATGIESAQAEIARLTAAAAELVAKLDECDPHIASLSALNFVRSGVQYTGPSYGEALEALRAALKGNQP